MRIVLWQNCLSPHQLPYIVHLLDDERVDEVVVVAGETLSGDRKAMGWNVAKYEGLDRCKVYVHPHDKIIEALFAERPEESQHLFSGIRADAFVFKCLQMSMAHHLKRGIITERPNTYDFKRNISNAKPYWMHRLRFWLQDRKYAKQIHTVFAMGQEAVDYFCSLGMKWQVFPFCYCTAAPAVGAKPLLGDRLPQYAYCGSLSPRKSPFTIVRAISRVDATIMGGVNLIGDGSLRNQLEEEIKRLHLEDKIHLLGTKPQTEVPLLMQEADVLILPSVYDGWGAVVNEALQVGCYVICSDACGASDLMKKEPRLGKVFRRGDEQALADCISWCNTHIKEIREDFDFRKQWAEEHISGKAVAKYMVECLSE